MELYHIQSALKELESSSFDINNSLTRVLRIAQYRLDIEEILFCKLIKVEVTKEKNKTVSEEVEKAAIKKGLSQEEFKKLFQKVYVDVGRVRKCNWYDNGKMLKGRIIPYSTSEIIIDLIQHQQLLDNNKFSETEILIKMNGYQAIESKKEMDNILNNHIINYKMILNKIKEFLIDYLVKVENELLSIRERDVMDTKKELDLLIQEGYEVKNKCSKPGAYAGFYISGSEYVAWIEKSKMFIKKNVVDKDFYSAFCKIAEKANGNDESEFEELIGRLKALLSYDFSEAKKEELSSNKIDKVFISHSSKDVEYVKALVQLLNDIGIKKSDEHIFCSSLPGYGIPYGENIYDFLKKELNNSNIMVLFVLSHNYYQSAPCLNEMGAAWITSKSYNSILTPNFDFRHISGAIDPSKISFYMNNENGLNTFKDKIVELFELDDVDYKIWGEDRKKFIENVKKVSDLEASNLNTQVQIERVKKVNENQLELQLRFINVTDKDIEFKFIDFELYDSNGNKLSLSAEDELLEKYILYGKENKVIKWVFDYDEGSSYNPRRDNSKLSKVKFEIYS
ncbi:toll/interleukin-1 receptor domain-containing protein [Peribacillus sp. YIM B13482]|uniref:toll/interleukin-1 receptor domain-containing protein n=1 Tax=Peribacillus sp. YIM B13482 TaxID=3366298 RepID=UPI00366BC7DA